MRPEFTASLMCMDFLDIKHQIEVLDQKLDGYHIDIMDGHYCKNITLSRDAGCQVGVTLNPATPLSYCRHYLNRIDVLTLMTVDVGYAGQPFIEEMLEKIAQAARMREENGWHYKIMIDGSCNKSSRWMLTLRPHVIQ